MRSRTMRIPLCFALAGWGCSLGCSLSWQDADPQGQSLQSYLDAHYRELGTRFVDPLTRAGLLEQLRKVRVLYLGDHHRDVGLHRQILELIDWLCEQGLRPVLGMEAIGSQDNPGLQEFLTGGIDLQELRERIGYRWPESWLEREDVDRVFFRELLVRARRHRLDAFPLEPTPRLPLHRRDGLIATRIRRALRIFPDRLVVVIVGHAHIHGDGHLQGRVDEPSLTITGRGSPALLRELDRHPPLHEGAFLRTDLGVLLFPPPSGERVSDQ